MTNKTGKLRDSAICIDNDLTEKERNIAHKARELVRAEKAKGRQAKPGYKKVQIDNEWCYWSDKEDDFVATTKNSAKQCKRNLNN